jgi:hypothetical protein
MVSSVASGNPRRLGRHAVDGGFRVDPLGRDRIRRDKSSGPPLLKLSLKVKGNRAHGKAPRSWPPRSQGLNARAPLKVRPDREQILLVCHWNRRVRSAVQSATELERPQLAPMLGPFL